jgi:hypothetical protein
MYLFTRQARLALGQQVKGTEWAVGITEKVNQITSLNVGLWTPVLSPGLGTLSWGAAVESLGDLEDADAKLMADPMYVDATERGASFLMGTADDQVAQFISNPDSGADDTHVAVVQSTLANGNFGKGVEVGVEIAERATKIGGLPTAFLLASTGTYAGCAWITSAPSIRALEAAEGAVNGDSHFIDYIDKHGDCFVEGITTQSIWRRIV